jgi:putative transposase
LLPTAEQAVVLTEHCRHARYVWNLAVGWGLLAARLRHKAYGRVEQIPAAYTSQRCSVCGHLAPGNRKSQAVFECKACTAGPCKADVNTARNIAAGRAVTAWGDLGASQSANREPQLCSPA